MSFACPHFDLEKDYCLALRADCVPGRPGCVLRSNSSFYVPVEQRLKERETPPTSPKPAAGRRDAQKRAKQRP